MKKAITSFLLAALLFTFIPSCDDSYQEDFDSLELPEPGTPSNGNDEGDPDVPPPGGG